MKIKFIMAIVAVAVMTGGCSSSDEVQQDGRVPIRLSATVESSKVSHTRAGTTGSTTQDTELLDGQTVAAYIKEKDGDWIANPLACTVSGTDGDLTYSGNYNYPMDGTPVTIFAVHPSSATSGNAFTVSANQTDADNYAASDLCYSKTADYNRQETAQTLTFNHVLSKIIVNVDVSGLGITPAPSVTNLKLRAKTQTTITYPTGSDPDYSLGEASTPGYIAMNVGGAAIIPPQTTIAAGDVRITFDVAGIGPIAYEFPASTSFESNKEYTFTVNVGSTITVTSSISDWGTSSSTNKTVEIGRPKLPIEYCEEYNMMDATTRAGDNNVSHSMYFSWNNSTASTGGATTPKEDIRKMINGTAITGSHLPSKAEWCSVFAPFTAGTYVSYVFDNSMGGNSGARITWGVGKNVNMRETVAWGVTNNNTSSTYSESYYSYDVNREFLNDYLCPTGVTIGYGLRFKELDGSNGRYTCAYRYEYKGTDDTGQIGSAYLSIKVIYVGYNQTIDIDMLNDEDENGFWKVVDFERIFPASGASNYTNGCNQPPTFWSSAGNNTISGYYWSATKQDNNRVYGASFDAHDVLGNYSYPPGYGISVRLFKDAE